MTLKQIQSERMLKIASADLWGIQEEDEAG